MKAQYSLSCTTDEFGEETWKLWDTFKNCKLGDFSSITEAIGFAKGMGINTKEQLTVDDE